MTQYGLGWIPDEPDARDALFATRNLFPTLDAPASCDGREWVADILDQNPLPSCVAQAVNGAIRAVQWHQDGGDPPELTSRFWTWYYARLQHGEHRSITGTYIRLAVKALNRLGRPPEHVWPHVLSDLDATRPTCLRKPPPVVSAHAHDKRLVGYHRILETGAERVAMIKRSVSQHHFVVFGTLVSQEFARPGAKARCYPRPGPSATIAGGHAMYIVGYDADGAWIANSWGTGWGDGGFAHLSWDYLMWYETRDLQAITLREAA